VGMLSCLSPFMGVVLVVVFSRQQIIQPINGDKIDTEIVNRSCCLALRFEMLRGKTRR